MRGKDVLRAGVIAGTTIAACGFQPTLNSDANPDGGLCMSASTECVQGADVLRTCPSAGAMYSDVNCAWGCTASGQVARCLGVVPSGSGGNAMNGVRPDDVAGGSDLTNLTTFAAGTILDGDSGKIGTSGNPTSVRGPGPGIQNGIDYELRGPIAMFRVNSLVIAGNIALVGNHPIALVAVGQVEIDGVIDGTGTCTGTTPGPGGFAGGAATKDASGSGGGSDGIAGGGGGGGGYGGGGGGGGYLSGAYSIGGGGWGTVDLALLRGGGGGGGAGAGNGGSGGGGGGALQIVSNLTIAFGPVGGINVGGCGGHHVTTTDPGGGGGAGGAILLEAPTIVVGNLAANGGGGGGGDIGGTDGTAGKLGTDQAPGGTAATGLGGAGGAGGAGNNLSGGNAVTGPACSHCGGGGGSVGRIRMNTRDGAGITNGPAASTSPTASTGSAAVQ
jgi:hypothetical protein